MICTSSDGYSKWSDQSPLSFARWKSILSKLTNGETTKQISSNSNPHHRSLSRQSSCSSKKQERQSLTRNRAFGDTVVDSFLVSSSSSNIPQTSIGISRQDVPQIISSPTKRYVSSFKTLVNSTSTKHPQRINYVKDSVIIFKLSKENTTENIDRTSQLSSKHSTLSMARSTTPPPRQLSSSPTRFGAVLRIEGQKRRTASNDSSIISSAITDIGTTSNSTHTMAMSASNHPSSNPSLFAYRNTVTAGSTLRQRPLMETNTNNLLITTERLKSNISSAMRPARQPITATTTISSAYMSSQPPQRYTSQVTRSRTQHDKLTNSKDLYEYPDPFTNCPPDILSKLAQLTKLQLETVDWEKKRRFTKKKPITNSTTIGKDSP